MINKINKWYDDLDKTHPTHRFLGILVLITILGWCIQIPYAPVRWFGIVGIASLALVRTIPIFRSWCR